MNSTSTNMLEALYHVPTNRLYLRLNGTNSFTTGHIPGTAEVILSDDRGALDVANTTVTRSGSTLTIHWRIAASSALAGANPIFLRAVDRAGANTGYFRPDGDSWNWVVG